MFFAEGLSASPGVFGFLLGPAIPGLAFEGKVLGLCGGRCG